MTYARLQLGRWGEARAVRYLRQRLYRIVATNYSNKCGEIDIIARRGKMLAFVEVKTRRSATFGSTAEAVTPRKQRQIIRTAQLYLLQNPNMRAFQPRFDVIGVLVGPGKDEYAVEHIPDAFGL
ncbi:MAG: YraN family protein [Desulfuromonadaceae bacterium]|nr:YraN family protein [Desulfuromonadaceae bacterium]